ncbi:methionine ABC transporter permease [Lacrimispora sp.]|uniref:methionine ABC transporter permease n=1 Tax=Lacrimispora sp. TaxID=2719234 RepID=UPI0028ACB5AE|nr:methionine ABC transporter permease [Lacrimispora sp.]
MRYLPWSEIIERIIIPSLLATLRMLYFEIIIGGILGFLLAIALYMTREHGLNPNKTIHTILNTFISIIRSFPFVILMVSVIPLTRYITGSSIGWRAALVPLTMASVPFIARMFENSFKEVNPSLIEAAKSFGASDFQIIFKVILADVLPSLISGSILCVIQVLNLTPVAGTIGAGGLGSSALQYGYQSFNDRVMYSVVLVLMILVIGIQFGGSKIYKRLK